MAKSKGLVVVLLSLLSLRCSKADWEDVSAVVQTSTLCDLTQTVQPVKTLVKLFEQNALRHNVSNQSDTDETLRRFMYSMIHESPQLSEVRAD